MKTKQAIALAPGDEIVSEGTFPITLYAGVVKTTIVVDAGVQIVLTDGGTYVRPEDHPFVVKEA